MRRHLTFYCEIAKAECHGKDILKEADLKLAKRKGLGDLRSIFQKSKSARTGNAVITGRMEKSCFLVMRMMIRWRWIT